MEAVNYLTFRKNLCAYLDKARDDVIPIMVTSKDSSANVVIINSDEYENMIENLYIQSNDYLVNKLKKGMEDISTGKINKHSLIEVEECS